MVGALTSEVSLVLFVPVCSNYQLGSDLRWGEITDL
jgi:hypothetical protein